MGLLEGRDLISTLDHSPDALRAVVERARAIKAGADVPDLAGKVATLLFFNPSVRTRVSCESAMARFGGRALSVSPGSETWRFEATDGAVMDGDTQEHVRELAPVLSRMSHVLGVRKSELITSGAPGSQGAAATESYDALKEDAFLTAFRRHAEVPVVNLESNVHHPMQGLADMQTLSERLGDPRGQRYVLTWAWHPKSLPVATPHSQLLAACDLGMDVVCLRPPGYDLDPDVTEAGAARAAAQGGRLTVTDDIDAAYAGARVVCAKAWGGLGYYGRFDDEARDKAGLRERWIVDADKLARTDDAFFLHCLPVRRNVVVADDVLDSNRSAVIDEAENRLWTQAAVFAELCAS